MKRFAAAAALLAFVAGAAAAVILPLRIAFQGKLLDPTTNLPKNGNVNMQFRLYEVPTGGTAIHTEPAAGFVAVPVLNGVFSHNIGTAALLTADMFAGASVYVGVTVQGDAEMTPRLPLSMSAYAFTAMQLASDQNIRINPGVAYSTFTTLGNLQMSAGVSATTGSFSAQGASVYSLFSSSGIYMSSGTLRVNSASLGIDASGTGIVASTGVFLGWGNNTFSIVTSSGINVLNGTLQVDATGGIQADYGIVASTGYFRSTFNGVYGLTVSSGILMSSGTLALGPAGKGLDATGTGLVASTLTLVQLAADPPSAPAGMLYVNSSSGTLKLNSAFNGWSHLGSSFQTSAWTTASGTAVTAAKAAVGTVLVTPIYISGPMVVNTMTLRVTTALGAAGDVGVYTSTGGLALNGGSGTLSTAAALKSIAPVQTNRFLRPGQYYAAVTWNSTTGVIAGDSFTTAGAVARCGSVLGGGSVLPATIAPGGITNLAFCYFVGLGQ